MTQFSPDLQDVITRLDALEAEVKRLRQSLESAEGSHSAMSDHPFVESVPDVLNGEPVINNTRTPVRAIVERWKFGESAEEIVRTLPHLRLAQVFDALGYYDDYRAEIEKFIELNRVPAYD
jgi:uncharacterized protein (DUF433 family)